MSKFDFTSLDGRSLKTLLTILEEESISAAAVRLGVTQSAVSHTLEKLRLILGDPLFVRVGRGIAPTEQARSLREPVQQVLDGMKALTDQRPFDPRLDNLEYTIAANDFQRDLIFPGLLRQLRAEQVAARFHFVPSGIPAAELLRQARCQLIVTPLPPEGTDIYQTRLFEDKVVCFYDAGTREPPRGAEDFAGADYIEVHFGDDESATPPLSHALGLGEIRPLVTVPNFTALTAFIHGSDLITLQLSLMQRAGLRGLATCPVPGPAKRLTMYMAWHKRDHADPAQRWLRGRVKQFTEQLLRDQGSA